MKRIVRKASASIILGLCLSLIFFDAGDAQVRRGAVTGTILNRGNQPIPGLNVYLVHPKEGRSSPRRTDNWGRFSFLDVPIRSDPYYLEVYWGKDLMYRNTVIVDRDKNLGNITLR